MDVIIFCTEEAECDQEVIEELQQIKHGIYKLQMRIPNEGQSSLFASDD